MHFQKAVSKIAFRAAGREDAPCLSALHSASFDRGWGEQEFLSFFDRDSIIAYLAVVESQSVGFVFGWVVADQCELLAIAVLPEFQGQGIAAQLTEKLVADAKEMQAAHIFLEVSVKNLAARHLYERFDFAITGRRSRYYQMNDGTYEDAITMAKSV